MERNLKKNTSSIALNFISSKFLYFLKKKTSTLSSCPILTEYHHRVDKPWGKSVTCKTRDGVHNHTFLAPPPSCLIPVVILALAAIGGDFFFKSQVVAFLL